VSRPGSTSSSGGGKSLGWESLARAAVAHQVDEEASLPRELLAFTLDGDPYAIPVEWVREIVRLQAITPIPRVPPEIRGVISMRGEVVQVVDLSLRLGVQPREPTRTSRIIVLHGDHGSVTGLLVDSVREVVRVAEEAIQPPPTGESDSVEALCRQDGEFISLLNMDRVLDLDGKS
jgi:purine-binding chemotaxis protein CheW